MFTGATNENDYLQESNSSVGDYENLPSARLSNEEALSNRFIETNEHEEEISQPIKSVEIQSKTSGRMVQAPQCKKCILYLFCKTYVEVSN